uniref:Uncharacterized protein n=1 Tax=Tanacetum cinerariifolium TaxID=118510 RepID=A0A6L2MUB1_TANCI|nr:hypothetical protein [Tanacetum cinerariifolium]
MAKLIRSNQSLLNNNTFSHEEASMELLNDSRTINEMLKQREKVVNLAVQQEQEPSYNQNYNDNYYPHDSPSFLCCDNCGGSHETFQCQPMNQNTDSSGFDQIQTPQYPIINEELAEYINSPSWNRPTFFSNDEEHSFQYKEYLKNPSNEIVASNFNQEKEGPPQDSDICQLVREECGIEVSEKQKKKMEDTTLELLEVCRQKEFYCMHNNVDDLIESALKSKLLSINLKSQHLDKKEQEVMNIVEQLTERGTRITESLQNFRVIHKKSSISLNNTSQIYSVHAIAHILPTGEPEYPLSMVYEHPNTTPKMELDEVIKSSVEKLVPILSEYEVNKNECDAPVCVDSSTVDVSENHAEILSDSNNDDISSDDDAFEDIEYVEATPPDSELVSLEEENDVYQEEEDESLNDNPISDNVLKSSSSIPIFEKSNNSLSDNSLPEFKTFSDHTEETRSGNTTNHANNSLPKYDSFCFEIEPDQERFTSVVKNNISDNSTNDPLLEEVNLFLASDNSIPPGIGNIDYDSKGDMHFLKELLVDDSVPIPKNESSDFDHQDDPSFPRPPPEPPDVEFFFDLEPNSGEVISAVMNNIDELNEDECFDPGGEIDVFANVEVEDYFPFIFVIRIFLPYLIYPEVFSLFLSAGNEDTIFDPGIFV